PRPPRPGGAADAAGVLRTGGDGRARRGRRRPGAGRDLARRLLPAGGPGVRGESLRARLCARLDPAGGWSAEGPCAYSDYDLAPEHRPAAPRDLRQAAVLIPVVDRPDGPTLLLTRRSDSLVRHTGQVAFPGGRLDAGEGPV